MNLTLECAEYYISQGWAVLPLYTAWDGKCTCGKAECGSPGKHPFSPLVPNGSRDATTDPEKIKEWFGGKHNVNIGICAGKVSGLVLLDIDPAHGGSESLGRFPAIPRTLVVSTGGGGTHYYFRHPHDIDVPNSAGTLGPGLDVRGQGGYVVAPPSNHISGECYKWVVDPRAIKEIPLCPEWIYLDTHPADRIPNGTSNDPIPEGQRDNRLTSMAGAMRRQGLEEPEILNALRSINERRCQPPMDDKTIQKIAKSVATYQERQTKRKPQLTWMCDVEPETIEWLWHNRVPKGKLTLMVGDGSVGKSFITLHMAAVMSCGGHWPDDDRQAPAGSTVILTTEDGLADTVRTRLDAMKADVSKIVIIENVINEDNKGRSWATSFNMRNHIDVLENTLLQVPDCRMIVFDPITAYMGRTDSHKNAEVRSALEPLCHFAAKSRVAVIGISHLNKATDQSALYRTIGSVGFVAAARIVWGFVFEDPVKKVGPRFMCPIKTNICIQPSTMQYDIVDMQVKWLDTDVRKSADEIMATSEQKGDRNELEFACQFLREELKYGDISSSRLGEMARREKISERTLARARGQVGTKSYRGEGGLWFTGLKR